MAAIRRWVSLLSVVVLFGLWGCSGAGDEVRSDHVEYELFPSTLQLGPSALGALDAVDPDGTLHFAGDVAQLAGVEPGRVLLVPRSEKTPKGCSRWCAPSMPKRPVSGSRRSTRPYSSLSGV